MKLGFIGAGRVGTGLAAAFAGAGHDVSAVWSRSQASARSFAQRVQAASLCVSPQQVLDRAELVFLTVPDDAIETVATSLQWHRGLACVHCSGAAELDVLHKPVSDGARAGGFHPLHMFGEPGESLDTLPGAAVALAGPDALIPVLEDLARSIGTRPFCLPAGARALYHGSATFVAAFVVALIQEAAMLWRSFGVAEREAIAALLPLLRGTADNVEKLGPAKGLGSAIARGDVGTIRKHLDVFAAQAPQSLELYRLLSLRTIPLALEKGTLKPETAREIEALLARVGPAP